MLVLLNRQNGDIHFGCFSFLLFFISLFLCAGLKSWMTSFGTRAADRSVHDQTMYIFELHFGWRNCILRSKQITGGLFLSGWASLLFSFFILLMIYTMYVIQLSTKQITNQLIITCRNKLVLLILFSCLIAYSEHEK